MLSRWLLILVLTTTITLSDGVSTLLATPTGQDSSTLAVSQPDHIPPDNPDSLGVLEDLSDDRSSDELAGEVFCFTVNTLDCHPPAHARVWARPVWHSPFTPALSALPQLLI